MSSKSTSKDVVTPVPAASGEELDRLYRGYRDRLRRYVAASFGPGPPDPEDVVQIAFEKFAVREDRHSIESPEAFLARSARNYVLDQRRRQKVRSDHAEGEKILGAVHDDCDAERVLSAKQRWQILERTIRAMDPRRQQVLIMNRIHGVSYAEIARRLKCSPTLVKMHAAQALVQCERALREAEEEI
ncbi:sigma-70 family RNA polymerase sigma factor [Novosphingobium sp. YJ-S2-02]|uniref:Sigma-70 family RNA polymerase sigma factor n=1 Tax=Novosphingobium aureum TaxID=2792964 RepID=A0A931HDG5_9SPHN|nr:sigma-70 family RNA polymerase sigma factor [Novosphingobium aureum]MBH0113448.1 sigma-70 family RNA polymerase sigma factor [Novosphingobium aureum]